MSGRTEPLDDETVLWSVKGSSGSSQIYNIIDETGMPLDHRPLKVVTKKGQKGVGYRTSGNKSQTVVISCISASGHLIPPFVIIDAKS